MIIVIKIFLSFLISLPGYSAYMSLSPGFATFKTKQMDELNSSLTGLDQRFEIGMNTKKAILSFYFQKNSLSGEVLHDDESTTIESSQFGYGLKLQLMLTKKFYGTVGFNVSQLKHKIKEGLAYRKESIEKSYRLDDRQNGNGFVAGLGYNIYTGRKYGIFGEYSYVSHSNLDSSTQTLSLGVRWSVEIRL